MEFPSSNIYIELVPYGLDINTKLYWQQLDHVYDKLKKRRDEYGNKGEDNSSVMKDYPDLVNRGLALFQQDNTSPHSENLRCLRTNI